LLKQDKGMRQRVEGHSVGIVENIALGRHQTDRSFRDGCIVSGRALIHVVVFISTIFGVVPIASITERKVVRHHCQY